MSNEDVRALEVVSSTRLRWGDGAVCVLIAIVITAVFWPIIGADFVWDDKIIFHDTAWFRGDGAWSRMLLHGFGEWKNYFRPLGLTLFFCEARLFGANPMPFHAVSLVLHIANAFVLSRLARAWLPERGGELWIPAFAMLFYGLHPTLVEPVSWIAAQCDLLATLFVFSGLLINAQVKRVGPRAVLVGICCLLGLLVKESAAALPLLVAISDWYARTDRTRSFAQNLRALVQNNAAPYIFLVGAVIVYAVLRHSILGGAGVSLTSPEPVRYVQTIAFLYMKYWQLVVSPVTMLSPMHSVLPVDLDHVGVATAICCAGSLLLILVGVLCTVRGNALGILVLGVTASLLSVLHLLPVEFDESLYHERYAIIAIAFFAAFFPVVLSGLAERTTRPIRFAAVAVGVVWLVAGVATARAIVPMWKNDVVFWQWASRTEPDSVTVMDRLMAAYIETNHLPEARAMATRLLQQETTCVTCLLNIAYLAIREGDVQQASAAVERAGVRLATSQPSQLEAFEYILTIGDLRQLQKDPVAAEAAYRDAISTDPLNPDGHFNLALLLLRQGRVEEAQAAMQEATKLSAPDELQNRIDIFDRVGDEERRRKAAPSQ